MYSWELKILKQHELLAKEAMNLISHDIYMGALMILVACFLSILWF